MRKFVHFFAMIFMALTFLAGCEKTTILILDHTNGYLTPVVPQNENGEFAISFGGYSASLLTKAAVQTVSTTGYDSFNLYAWNSIGETVMNPYRVLATGENAYDYTQVDGQSTQYFRNAADNYEFIGVIPETLDATFADGELTVEGVVSDTVDDERVGGTITADSDNEFLWVYKKVEKNEYGSTVVLPFVHGNALLYLGFKSDRNDTELLNYTPYSPGTPGTEGTPAWDEVVDVTEYSMTTTTIPMLGPLLTAINISDEDLEFVNSKYSASKGFTGYATNNAITGNLDENMWDYLVNKYPALSSVNLENWDSPAANENMRLVHIDKTGHNAADNDSYRGVWVNVQSVNWNAGTTHQETIHHDAIPGEPGTPATGLEGIRVFSANYESEHYVHKAHTTVADAHVSAEGLTFDNRTTSTEVIGFSLPANTTLSTTPVFSPTTFYAIPGDTDLNNFVVKFSYTYNGITVYDVRVPLTLPAGGLVAGKYYKYVINITSVGNGQPDPNKAEDEADDIDVTTNPVISVTLTEVGYTEGIDETVNI